MRHRVGGKKLNRHYKDRERLMTQLMTAIIDHRRITTTQAKAQALRPEIEKLISMARHAPSPTAIEAAVEAERDSKRRQRADVFRIALMRLGGSKRAAHRLLEVAPDYADRPGGYTRLTKLGPRRGDAAEMVVIELV